MLLRKHVLFWLPCSLLGSTTVCSPPGLARHPAGRLWLKRAWTDGAVEGGSWKHTKSVEEPKNKMRKLKFQPTMVQKEYASYQENLEKSTKGQPSSPTHLTYSIGALQKFCSFLLSLKELQKPESSTTCFYR